MAMRQCIKISKMTNEVNRGMQIFEIRISPQNGILIPFTKYFVGPASSGHRRIRRSGTGRCGMADQERLGASRSTLSDLRPITAPPNGGVGGLLSIGGSRVVGEKLTSPRISSKFFLSSGFHQGVVLRVVSN